MTDDRTYVGTVEKRRTAVIYTFSNPFRHPPTNDSGNSISEKCDACAKFFHRFMTYGERRARDSPVSDRISGLSKAMANFRIDLYSAKYAVNLYVLCFATPFTIDAAILALSSKQLTDNLYLSKYNHMLFSAYIQRFFFFFFPFDFRMCTYYLFIQMLLYSL